MPLNPLNHYALENPASVYDEEALTALELAGRTATKVNEAVQAFNELETETNAHLDAQDTKLGNTLEAQDKAILKMNNETMPAKVAEEMEKRIEDGTFTEQIDNHTQELQEDLVLYAENVNLLSSRVDNLAKLTAGSTTGDAELIDARTDADGVTHTNLGTAIRRNQVKRVNFIDKGNLNDYTFPCTAVTIAGCTNAPEENTGILVVEYSFTAVGNNPAIVQKWTRVDNGRTYHRTKMGSNWCEWWNHDIPAINFYNASVDLNTLETSQRGVALGGCPHAPENTTGLLETLEYRTSRTGTPWIVQTWRGVSSGNLFHRTKDSVGWYEWSRATPKNNSHPLSEKVVVFLGDSIFGNTQDSTGIVNQFQSITGAVCHNFAFGGTRAKSRNENNGWNYFDGEELTKAIASGDFSKQTSALSTMSGVPGYFSSTLEKLKAFDFSTADYVVCNWGTNDYTGGHSASVYKTGITNALVTLCTAYPNLVFIKCTPTARFDDNGKDMLNMVYSGGGVATVKQLIDADKEFSESCRTQLIDLYNIGINQVTRSHFFDGNDGTHQNANGRKRIATYLAQAIK